jgi:hypothetical protein
MFLAWGICAVGQPCPDGGDMIQSHGTGGGNKDVQKKMLKCPVCDGSQSSKLSKVVESRELKERELYHKKVLRARVSALCEAG